MYKRQSQHGDRFEAGECEAFFSVEFAVSGTADRMGVRLEGRPLRRDAAELLTCGVVAGAVQVPGGGDPIVLLADHQTTGGYPIVATVCSADLGVVAQRSPGERIRFYEVRRDEAVAALREARAALAIR